MPDTKISLLSDAGALAGTEIVPLANGGANERTTTQAIANLAAGGGAFTLISTLTAAASATLAWTGLTGTSWHLRAGLILPATNTADLRLRVGTGAGPTYITTDYDWELAWNNSAGAAASQSGSAAQAQIVLQGSNSNVGAGFSGTLDFITDNATFFRVTGVVSNRASDGNYYAARVGGGGVITAPITAIQLYFSAGNITSGKASLYSVSG